MFKKGLLSWMKKTKDKDSCQTSLTELEECIAELALLHHQMTRIISGLKEVEERIVKRISFLCAESAIQNYMHLEDIDSTPYIN